VRASEARGKLRSDIAIMKNRTPCLLVSYALSCGEGVTFVQRGRGNDVGGGRFSEKKLRNTSVPSAAVHGAVQISRKHDVC
jgi:hypothetical protein